MNDTIFAPATAAGRAAVAVLRISGPETAQAVRAVAGRLPRPRRAVVRTLRGDGRAIDAGLVLWFPGPASYTGEDCAEFHVHGGGAVVAALIEALRGEGLRLAEPGEFTRRAFEHGKLDLAQAEGVADLIDAETEAQRRQALAQLGGALSQTQARWRYDLTEALAMLEAAVDFPDEELPQDVAGRARPALSRLLGELEAAVRDAERGARVREGFRIALVGAPNAGKSTLLNALAGRDAAIVTAIPGTTRDVIEVPMLLGGYKVLLADTAGLRETADPVEVEGVRRAQAWAETADLRLWLVDGSDGAIRSPPPFLEGGDVCVVTKADLPKGLAAGAAWAGSRLTLSATNPEDVRKLRELLAERVVEALGGDEPAAATRLRHRDLLSESADHIRRAMAVHDRLELAAEDVRLAARALDRITGRIGAEDVLDRIFSSFCIGK